MAEKQPSVSSPLIITLFFSVQKGNNQCFVGRKMWRSVLPWANCFIDRKLVINFSVAQAFYCPGLLEYLI